MELGKQLKDARAKAGLSQEELAKRIGVSRQTISNWENCRSYPDIGSLIKLSDLYGLSLDAMRPEWYPAGSPDPEPYFKLVSVVNKATLNLGDQGLAGETLTLVEEYHHGDSVEITTHTLTRSKNGGFSLKLETRYDGVEEYALYRIPYLDGEYRFTLTFGK